MLTREKFVPYLQMIAEIQHISGPTWSEHDVMSLIKTQNDFVNNPLACPITRAKCQARCVAELDIPLSFPFCFSPR